MSSNHKPARESSPSPSSSAILRDRILLPTMLAGVVGAGVGLVSKHRKVHGLANISATYATNFAIVAGCYCGAREFVRVSRTGKPDDLLNSAIGGFGSGAILGRLQGGQPAAVRYSVMFAVVGTTVDYATIKLKPVLRNFYESLAGKEIKLPEWSPIQILDEEAQAAKRAREQQIYDNIHKEVGGNHAQSVGFSTGGFATTPTMRKLNLIWVTARMHIEIYKYPAWSDVVEIETWCQGEGRIGTRRDWIMKDCATGEVIGRATSKWLMMNHKTRRLQKVSDDVRNEVLVFCPIEPRLSFPEENNGSLKKISKLEDPAAYSKIGLVPRRADLDMNHHVNNVTYIGWVLESVPQDTIDSYELQSITLDYKRECQYGDVVDSLTSPEPSEDAAIAQLAGSNGSASATKDGNKPVNFLHFLKLSADGQEINRCRTEWRKKPAKR